MSSALPELQVRNSEPKQVALAVLDFCEHAARGATGGLLDTEDGAFMAVSVLNYMSRVRTLKREAAAQWRNEFTRLLESCHSLTFQKIGSHAKEDVRAKKMHCMACGRQEKRCPYVLRMVGPFNFKDYTGEGSNLTRESGCIEAVEKIGNIRKFMDEYTKILQSRDKSPSPGALPPWDMGDYAIGNTCFRKAILFYLTNTLLLEEAFSASVKSSESGLLDEAPSLNGTWRHATPFSADALLGKLEKLQLAIGNPMRSPPSIDTDEEMWTTVSQVRKHVSSNDRERLGQMLRERAASLLNIPNGAGADLCVEVDSECEEGLHEGDSGAEEDHVVGESDDEEWPGKEHHQGGSADSWIVSDHEEEDSRGKHAGSVDDDDDSSEDECRIRHNPGGRGRRSVICESEDGDESEQEEKAAGQGGKRMANKHAMLPTRKSRRVQSLDPEIRRGIGDSPTRGGEPEEDREPEPAPPPGAGSGSRRAVRSSGPPGPSKAARSSSHRHPDPEPEASAFEDDLQWFGGGPRNEGPRTTASGALPLDELESGVDMGVASGVNSRVNSGMDGMNPSLVRPRLRRAFPGARSLAGIQRRPDGRLAARNQAMVDLSMLTTRLLQEGLEDYAAVCTQAVFVMQEQRDMLASARF
jgi:hypothetical protein